MNGGSIMEKTKRKEKEFQLRRADILDEAEKIFAAKGFHSTTMAEIARASGFAIGTLYQYFNGKENLYGTMVSEKLDRMYAEIRVAVAGGTTVMEKLEALVNSHFNYVENNLDYWKILIRAESITLSDEDTSLKEKIISCYLSHIHFVEKIIKEGIRTKFFKPIDPFSMACALNGIMSSFKFIFIMKPRPGSLKGRVSGVLDIFLKGVKNNAV
jgi:AcrR family transcriptional regulator